MQVTNQVQGNFPLYYQTKDSLLPAVDGAVVAKGDRAGWGDGYVQAVMVNYLVKLVLGLEILKLGIGEYGFHYFFHEKIPCQYWDKEHDI